MNREQARRRLEQTSNFTLVGGRVLITDQRLLAAVAQLRAANATHAQLAASPRPTAGSQASA